VGLYIERGGSRFHWRKRCLYSTLRSSARRTCPTLDKDCRGTSPVCGRSDRPMWILVFPVHSRGSHRVRGGQLTTRIKACLETSLGCGRLTRRMLILDFPVHNPEVRFGLRIQLWCRRAYGAGATNLSLIPRSIYRFRRRDRLTYLQRRSIHHRPTHLTGCRSFCQMSDGYGRSFQSRQQEARNPSLWPDDTRGASFLG
jgi:hypothetical protein